MSISLYNHRTVDTVSGFDITIWGDFCPYQDSHNERLDIDSILISILCKSVINCLNLECPITGSENPIKKTGPSLKAAPDAVNALKRMNINLCNLANNHIMDFGSSGINDTKNVLDSKGIVSFGIDGADYCPYTIIQVGSKKIALASFTENEYSTEPIDGIRAYPLDYSLQFTQISELKLMVDFVIVQYHGGLEFYPYPTPNQKKYAHYLIDIGASMVICHHSHCISGYEQYNGAPIFYGLGNFYFPEKGNSDSWYKGFGLGINIVDELDVTIIPICYDIDTSYLHMQTVNADSIISNLEQINQVINSDTILCEKWYALCRLKQEQTLKAVFQPNIIERALLKTGLLRFYFLNKVSLGMMNNIRCESHYEKVLITLKQVLGVIK